MKSHRSPDFTLRAHALVPTLLSALILSACGGDSSNHHDNGPGALKITDDNAARVTAQALAAQNFLPLTLMIFTGSAYDLAKSTECESGSLDYGTSSDADDNERLDFVSFDNCETTSGGDDYREVIDGKLEFTYDSPAGDAPVFLNARRFSAITQETSESGDAELALELDGSVKIGSPSSPLSLTETNLTLRINAAFDGDIEASPLSNFNLSLKDWSSVHEAFSDDLEGVTTEGRLTLLDDDLNGYVDLITNEPQTYGGATGCPVSGDISINGADSSSINLYFVESDLVRITVNDVAQPDMTCDEFAQWVFGGSAPFTLANTASPFNQR